MIEIQPSQVRKWRNQEDVPKAKVKVYPAACSTHTERLTENPKLENYIFDWIIQQREAKIAVSTSSIVAKLFLHSLILKMETEKSYAIGSIRFSPGVV